MLPIISLNFFQTQKLFYQKLLQKYINPLVDLITEISKKSYREVNKITLDTLKEQIKWSPYNEKHWLKSIFSTRLFSRLGYDGIDVRNTQLDNTMFGCVIWNIKPEDVIVINDLDESIIHTKNVVKKFDEFVNELLNSTEYNDSVDIESSYFVVYKDKIYLFDFKSKDFRKNQKFF